MTHTTYPGTTTRSIVFYDSERRITDRRPAGTAIYARPLGTPGMWRVRVQGTLLTQDVRQGTFNVTS